MLGHFTLFYNSIWVTLHLVQTLDVCTWVQRSVMPNADTGEGRVQNKSVSHFCGHHLWTTPEVACLFVVGK